MNYVPFVNDIFQSMQGVPWKWVLPFLVALVGLYLSYRTYKLKLAEKRVEKTFDIYQCSDSNDIKKLKRELFQTDKLINYISRLPENAESVQEKIADVDKVLVTGRKGIGKTRECVEAIIQFEEQGDPATVFYPRSTENIDWPTNFKNLYDSRPVLFIDNIEKAYRIDDAKLTKIIGVSDFHDRLTNTIEKFEKKYRGSLRIIINSSTDLSLLKNLTKREREYWKEFSEYQLPQIHIQIVDTFIKEVANFYSLNISSDAIQYIKDVSDLTFKGIIHPLRQLSKKHGSETKITIEDVKKLTFSWPVEWDREIYNHQIEDYPLQRSVFEALSILNQLWIDPYEFLVVSLAAELNQENWFFFKEVRIRNTIHRNLKRWIFISDDGRVICQDSYTQGKGELTDNSISSVRKALHNCLNDKSKFYKLLPHLNRISNRLIDLTGEYDLSIGFLEKALEIKSDYLPGWRTLYSIYLSQENYEGAIDAAKKLEKFEYNEISLHRLSLVYGEKGDYEKAIYKAREAINLNESYTPARQSLVISLVKSSLVKPIRYKEAIDEGEYLVNLDGTNPAYHHSLSIAYKENKDYDKAIEEAQDALDIDNDYIEARHTLLQIYVDCGDYSKAITEGELLIEAEDDNTKYHHSLSIAYKEKGDYKNALKETNIAIDRDPSYMEAWKNKIQCLIKLNDSKRAVDIAQELVKNKESAQSYYYLSIAYNGRKDFDKAVDAATEAIKIDENFVSGWYSRSINLGELCNFKKAISDKKEVINLRGSADDYRDLAALYGKDENCSEALKAANKALEIVPSHIGALESKIYSLSSLGERESQIPLIKKLIVEDSLNAIYWEWLAAVYYKTDKLSEAETAARESIHLDKTYVKAWERLFKILKEGEDKKIIVEEGLRAIRQIGFKTIIEDGGYILYSMSRNFDDLSQLEAKKFRKSFSSIIEISTEEFISKIENDITNGTLWRMFSWFMINDNKYNYLAKVSIGKLKENKSIHNIIFKVTEELITPGSIEQKTAGIEILETLVEVVPDEANYLNLLGVANRKIGKVNEAIKQHQKVLEITKEINDYPDHKIASYQYSLGRAYEKEGSIEDACNAYNKAIDLNNHNGARKHHFNLCQ